MSPYITSHDLYIAACVPKQKNHNQSFRYQIKIKNRHSLGGYWKNLGRAWLKASLFDKKKKHLIQLLYSWIITAAYWFWYLLECGHIVVLCQTKLLYACIICFLTIRETKSHYWEVTNDERANRLDRQSHRGGKFCYCFKCHTHTKTLAHMCVKI